MADNYLEKKYEELRQGKPVLRRSTPSLDTLLHRLVDAAPVGDGSPSSFAAASAAGCYVVKQAQLDAMVRSAGLLGCHLSFETAETSAAPGSAPSTAFIRITSLDGPIALGQAILAIRLKAAELSLSTSVTTDDPCAATVRVFR